MTKAEEILEKHLVDYDTRSYTSEDRRLKQCYLNAINEALNIPVVNYCEDEEPQPTDKQEPLIISMKKEKLVMLYNFAYEQALKTGKVNELHDIDEKLHSL
jgi:hypothetical protein